MDLGDERQNEFQGTRLDGKFGRLLLWYLIHFVVSIWYFLLGLIDAIKSFLISKSVVKSYKSLDISKVKYLAVVIDSEEALQTPRVIKLLQWLESIGLKKVCLYDPEGVLEKFKEPIIKRLKSEKILEGDAVNGQLPEKCMALEFASASDGKEAVAKAANVLFKKHCSGASKEKLNFTESDVAEALRVIGCGKPEPDLMLVYGPVRCHLGFPPWRLRYTEIVYMGSLKYIKFGSLMKAIHRFTKVRQNYGT